MLLNDRKLRELMKKLNFCHVISRKFSREFVFTKISKICLTFFFEKLLYAKNAFHANILELECAIFQENKAKYHITKAMFQFDTNKNSLVINALRLTNEQQDAQEFTLMLFDSLDRNLLTHPNGELIRQRLKSLYTVRNVLLIFKPLIQNILSSSFSLLESITLENTTSAES